MRPVRLRIVGMACMLYSSQMVPVEYEFFSAEDLRIWPIDCDNAKAIEHLVSIKRPDFIRVWRKGYDEEGTWTPSLLSCCVEHL